MYLSSSSISFVIDVARVPAGNQISTKTCSRKNICFLFHRGLPLVIDFKQVYLYQNRHLIVVLSTGMPA